MYNCLNIVSDTAQFRDTCSYVYLPEITKRFATSLLKVHSSIEPTFFFLDQFDGIKINGRVNACYFLALMKYQINTIEFCLQALNDKPFKNRKIAFNDKKFSEKEKKQKDGLLHAISLEFLQAKFGDITSKLVRNKANEPL